MEGRFPTRTFPHTAEWEEKTIYCECPFDAPIDHHHIGDMCRENFSLFLAFFFQASLTDGDDEKRE